LIGYGFSKIDPNHHAFSLADPTISFPFTKVETVSTEALILVSLFAPAVIILIGAWLLTPGTAAPDGPKPSTSQIIRRKVWEWNAGWLGLVVALAGVWLSTQGLKDLVGKPRPDLLARCNPDLSNIAKYAIGGLGEQLQGAPTLVSWKICQDQSELVRIDGFSSFPSGHSSCMLFHRTCRANITDQNVV
jgi:membrane-associated phospholipid phosphatase